MASKEEEGGCVTLTWEIQNFGLILPLEEKKVYTPFWTTEHTGKRVWRRLGIHLAGSAIVVNISRTPKCLHLDSCQILLISTCMEVPLKLYHRNSDSWYYTIKKDAVIGEERQSILHNGTLTLRCKMWEKTIRTREFRINSLLHSFSYLWNIKNFRQHDFYSEYIEEEKFLFKACLESKSENCTHNFTFIGIPSIEHCVSSIDCKLSDKDGSVRVLRKFLNKNNTRILEVKISLNSTSLNLQLESVFTVHKICPATFKLPSPPRYENASEAVSGALGEDLLLLYKDNLFSDATLNAEGKSFHVHRSILSARSPVFRAMFEKDEMSEGREKVVYIDDVDSETVDRMLVYLYGDSLGSVHQWEEASALYYAADKYDIRPLKHKCAKSLKEALTVDNACESLVLADRHSDDQLMKYIVDFIHQNEEVVSSKKWDSLQITNPMLSSKILREMYLKIKKK